MFTFDEINLMCIYNTGTRLGLIDELTTMQGFLQPDETELLELTQSALAKLRVMSDEDFAAIELMPDYGEDEQEV